MHASRLTRTFVTSAVILLTCHAGIAQSVSELVAKGDISDAAFHPGKALESYLPAEKLDPKNVDILLRIARQYRHLMSDTGDVKEKLRLGGIALAYGKKSATLAPNNSEAQLCQAITYGKMLPIQGKQEQVDAAPLIKAAVDRALKLDPLNDSAWHVLGRWHQSLANVGGLKRAIGGLVYGKLPTGTNAKSIACFDEAIKINPKRLRHYIEQGRTYAQMGDHASARRLFKKGLAMPNTEKDDTEMKLSGREALADLP
jgi:tetratricopeptide (TPR) repeat protein